ncbi:hypothetical protein [Streptomyces sp. LN590]|uniref:hypothetical protein n=1 Tax=Streptomyces sp. LN590 TaxID=3112980 RepID=UPI003710D492
MSLSTNAPEPIDLPVVVGLRIPQGPQATGQIGELEGVPRHIFWSGRSASCGA